MMIRGTYDVGLLKDIMSDIPTKKIGRPFSRRKESKDAFSKKKKAKKMAKASRRRNRG